MSDSHPQTRHEELAALRAEVRAWQEQCAARLELLHKQAADMLALQTQLRDQQLRCTAGEELLQQRDKEIAALRQRLGAVQHDAFQWLLTSATRPPQPFTFAHPAEPARVSVVVPAYNASAFLERSIRSIWEQTLPPARMEILLCEDGSPDNTYDLALALQRHSPVPLQVLTHPNRVNRGVSATRNLGLQQARGEYIALLDADDVWLPQRLAVQLDYLNEHPWVQCVCSLGYNRDHHGQLVRGWNGTTLAGDYRQVPPPNDVQAPYTFEHLLKTDPVVNSTLLIRREAVAAVGGYPEVMAHQAEDWLLLAKLSLHAPIELIEQPLIDYTIHPNSYSSQYFAQGLAYGVRIEFLFHLIHWMIQHPQHRDRGTKLFRQNYPRLLAAHSKVGLLLEEFHRKHEGRPAGLAEFESHLAGLHEELEKLRRFRARVEKLLRPLGWFPGLKKAVRAVWRFHANAQQRRSA